MPTACECGMSVESPERRSRCRACGGDGCRSCLIEVESEVFCRWCAATFAAA